MREGKYTSRNEVYLPKRGILQIESCWCHRSGSATNCLIRQDNQCNTHVADPDDLVGRGVRPDLAGQVDVAALGDAARVDVRTEGEDHSGRICKKRGKVLIHF